MGDIPFTLAEICSPSIPFKYRENGLLFFNTQGVLGLTSPAPVRKNYLKEIKCPEITFSLFITFSGSFWIKLGIFLLPIFKFVQPTNQCEEKNNSTLVLLAEILQTVSHGL